MKEKTQKRKRLKARIVGFLLGASAVPLGIFAFVSLVLSTGILEQEHRQFSGHLEAQALGRLERGLGRIRAQVEGRLDMQAAIARAAVENKAFDRLFGRDPEAESAERNCAEFFARGLELAGIRDLFLISPEGRVASALRGREHVGRSLSSSLGHGDDLARVWRRAKAGGEVEFDLEDAGGQGEKGACFLAMRAGQSGFVLAEIAPEAIRGIFEGELGAAGSQRILLADPQGRLRSVFPSTAWGVASESWAARWEPVLEAVAGRAGRGRYRSPAGEEVLAAFAPVRLGSGTWALVASAEPKDVLAPVGAMSERISRARVHLAA